MNNLAVLTAQPVPFTVAGRDYKVHPLTLDDFGLIQAWVDHQFPDPLELLDARLEKYPVPLQKHLLKSALEIAAQPKPRLGSEEANRLAFQTVDGIKELLYLAIHKGDPLFTRGAAALLAARIGLAGLALILKATGADQILNASESEGVSDPKAQAAEMGTGTGTGTESTGGG